MPDGGGIRTFGEKLPGVTYVERPGSYAFILDSQKALAVVKTSFGMFLPGGGIDAGEDEVTGLARELREEIGYEVVRAIFLMKAAQYHWSEFYQSYFRKVGSFFEVEARPPKAPQFAPGHSLLWIPIERACWELTQEFQRWAASEFARIR